MYFHYMNDARDTVVRIYNVEYYTLLHTPYESSGPCGIIVRLWKLMTPGEGPFLTPGAGFM